MFQVAMSNIILFQVNDVLTFQFQVGMLLLVLFLLLYSIFHLLVTGCSFFDTRSKPYLAVGRRLRVSLFTGVLFFRYLLWLLWAGPPPCFLY